MSIKKKWLTLVGIVATLFVLIAPLLACGASNGSNGSGPAAFISAGADAIGNEAIDLEKNLFGPRTNLYNPAAIPQEFGYWSSVCGLNTECWASLFAPGSLQCVSFVTGVFAALHDPLPASGNAIDFWGLYQNRPGWQRITNGQGAPQVGDIVVWSGGQYGHVAIVVGTTPPTGNHPGTMTVGQANAPGNTAGPAPNQGGNFYTMTWKAPRPGLPAGYVDTWPGFAILGFIRQLNGRPADVTPVIQSGGPPIPSGMPGLPPLTSAQNVYALQALQAAAYYQLPTPTRLVVQLDNESRLNPNVGHSSAGAIGIAQFMPGTAAGIPCSVLRSCTGGSFNPNDPAQAIEASAHYMHSLYTDFLTYTSNSDQAYAYAVAAYNAGEGNVQSSLRRCSSAQWIQCLPNETIKYVNCIMQYDRSQCNFNWP